MVLILRSLITLILLLSFYRTVDAKLTLREIHTAARDVLVVFFTSDTVDLAEADTGNLADWKINGQPAQAAYRFVTQADRCDHYIFLQTSALIEGQDYLVQTPYGETKIRFTARDILCESIKINQSGYSARSKTRYANFAIWLGDGGSRKIEGPLPRYEVFEQFSAKRVLKGNLNFLGEDQSSGDAVYRIDLSRVPEGGPYKIVVNGYGCSYPFGVGGEFSKRTAYTLFRAQYLQRCGCPIAKPPIREKACHTLIYDVDGPIGEANIVVAGTESTFVCYGGYHDAGDADRRAYHLANPIINLMIYEAFPDLFLDGQFDIPGEFDGNFNSVSYTNDIPDIIDEAEWGALAWEYLQNRDGSIHFGTETKGYPDPFAAPMDQDSKKYGTVKVDPRATSTAAGLFMHLARILKPYKPEQAAELMERALRAVAYGEQDMADPEKLYFYIQKYLLTQDENAHRKIKELYTIADSLKYNMFLTPGYSLNDRKFDNPAYIWSYIIEKKVRTDPAIVEFFKSAIRAAADSNLTALKEYAYPVGNSQGLKTWGHNIRQPMYACAPLLQWKLSGKQEYFDTASELMDYKLGLNPPGISYVTGLGFHQVHNPHDRESAYTVSKGWGPKPGITIFGPGVPGWGWKYARIYPAVNELSGERQFVDDLRMISFTEFTIFETMAHDALYTVLAGGGKWNGRDPFTK
jgi:endoglucanase